MTEGKEKVPDFTRLTDLAAARLGGQTLVCSDDFFAPMENLLKEGRGIFIADKYTDHGKWMDGWESRRKRTPGHDWCILQLGASGVIRGVDIDTNHFLGNHPPQASLEGIRHEGEITELEASSWTSLLPKVPLEAGSHNFFEISDPGRWTHLKLNIYPDGGVARLKVYGEVFKNWDQVGPDEVVDLAAALNGGRAILCNDMFFSHMNNLILPGKGLNMGDGWETKRNRTPGNKDWVILKLGAPGVIEKIVVDTHHFKGNYPDTCSLDACYSPHDLLTAEDLATAPWTEIITPQKLEAHREHTFEPAVKNPFNYVRLNIYPDGGVSRLRIWGRVAKTDHS